MTAMNAALFPNTGKPEMFPFFKKMSPALEEEGIHYYLPHEARPYFEAHHIYLDGDHYKDRQWLGTHAEIGLSIGGDGSFLQAAREMAQYPILLAGVHLGDLGFLNTIAPSHMKERFRDLRYGRYQVERRLFLTSFIRHEDGTETVLPDVLNDIVVGHDKIGKMCRLRLRINDRFFQQYPADGLVISTPTGSTSYALSCGGPILPGDSQNMLIVPICPHMIQNFSLVLSRDDEITIQLPEREKKLHISMDGNGEYNIRKKEEIHIRGKENPIGFIRFAGQDFYSAISSKLFPKICTI